MKIRIPDEEKKGVVYEIPCHGCDQVYVGETGRTMKMHTSELYFQSFRIHDHFSFVDKSTQGDAVAVSPPDGSPPT